MSNQQEITKAMQQELANYPDEYLDCGEVNLTKLAEAVSIDFPWVSNDEIFFEIAFTVAQRWEKQTHNNPAWISGARSLT